MVTRHVSFCEQKPAFNQTQAAKILKISREHLNRCINGRRSSKRLMCRYRELINPETKNRSTRKKNYEKKGPANSKETASSA